MDYNKFRILITYDIKLIVRNSAFKIFTSFSMFSMFIYVLLLHTRSINPGMETWDNIALPSFIPLFSIIPYNIILCILIVYLNNYFPSKKIDTYDTIYVKPISNCDYVLGKSISIIFICTIINIAFCLTCIGIQFLGTNSPFGFWYYTYVLTAISFPIFIFVIGLTLFFQIIIKIKFLSSLLVLLILIVFLRFSSELYGILDLFCLRIPTVISEIAGFPFGKLFLYQRLFFFLIGMSFILISVITMRRLDYGKQIKIKFATIGVLLFVVSCLIVYNYYMFFHKNILLHEEYRKIYCQYSDYNYVKIIKHDIEIDYSDGFINAKSNITVCNDNLEVLSKIILFLNPGLKIDSIRTNHDLLNYQRKYQVIEIETMLQPKDTMLIHLSYFGQIDEYICYTDVDIDEYMDFKTNFTYQYGKKYAFLSKEYVLLTPECLWYPVSLPPNNPIAPYEIKRDFTYFTLKIRNICNKKVISQGIEKKGDKYIEFLNLVPLPYISLTIGDYEKFSIVVDSVNYELFYYPDHNFYVNYFKDVRDSIVQIIHHIRSEQEYMRNSQYIFSKFSFVEVPIQFYSYNRRWKGNTEFVMPEIIYFPEHGTQLGVDLIHLSKEYERKKKSEGIYDKNKCNIDIFRIFINNILTKQTNVGWMGLKAVEKNKLNNSPMFFEFINYIHSDTCPLIDIAFNTILQNYFFAGRKNAIENFINSGIDDTQRALLYLKSHSLKEASLDRNISSGVFSQIMKLKTQELRRYLTTLITEQEIKSFFLNIMKERPFTVISFDSINDLFFQKYNVHLSKFINLWYMNSTVAKLYIKDVKLLQVNDQGVIKNQVSFEIENISKSYGVITVTIDNKVYNNYYIEPNKRLEINICCDHKPTLLTVNTNISQNFPSDYSFELYYATNSISSPKDEIIILDINKSVPKLHTDIIIDDLSNNFSIIENKPKRKLFASKKSITELYSKINYKFPPNNWTKIASHSCYGNIIRSAFYKKKGHGNSKIVWNIPIEKARYYEIFIWNVKVPYKNVERVQNYTILNAGNLETIAVDFVEEEDGWISVGNFYLTPPLLEIELTDNVSGDFVIADAIKVSPL